MVVTEFNSTNPSRDQQFKKAECPISVTLAKVNVFVRAVQSWNALEPIDLTPIEVVKLVSAEQPWNAAVSSKAPIPYPTCVMPSP